MLLIFEILQNFSSFRLFELVSFLRSVMAWNIPFVFLS